MIHIVDNIYLSVEPCNYILNKKSVDKKTGEEKYTAFAYFSKIDCLYRSLINRKLTENEELIKNLKATIQYMDTVSRNLQSALEEMIKYKPKESSGDPFEDIEDNEIENNEEDDI